MNDMFATEAKLPLIDDKRTKIVCTLGPATEDDDVLRAMMLAGMNVARLNFSHGDHAYHRANIERVRRIAAELNKNIAIMTDTKGPEIRTRANEGGEPVKLSMGETVYVTTANVLSRPGLIALDYEPLPYEVSADDVIFIDDGLIGLKVLDVEGDRIRCVVTDGGKVLEHKGVNVPTVRVSLPAVTERDIEDIRFSCEMGVDAIAASFVRDAGAVYEIKDLCKQFGAPKTMVISKIESAFAVEHFDEILEVSDGIMVARGDLGVEIPPADVPHVQNEVIRRCNDRCKPVITATQMLESMTVRPRPTRAEVTDVAAAIAQGSDCVMLSGETAAGAHPVEAVATMAEICRKAEKYLEEFDKVYDDGDYVDVSDTTGSAAVIAARRVGAKILLCPTISGRTARIMASLRPRLPIVAATPLEHTMHKCCFYWGVEAVLSHELAETRSIIAEALERAQATGFLDKGDVAVVTVGDSLSSPMRLDGRVTSDVPANVMVIAQVH